MDKLKQTLAEALIIILRVILISGAPPAGLEQIRRRFSVNLRYMRDSRSDATALARVLVPARKSRLQIPIAQLASIRRVPDPSKCCEEDGLLFAC